MVVPQTVLMYVGYTVPVPFELTPGISESRLALVFTPLVETIKILALEHERENCSESWANKDDTVSA